MVHKRGQIKSSVMSFYTASATIKLPWLRASRGVSVKISSSPNSILTVPSGNNILDMIRETRCLGVGMNTARCTRII